MTDERNPLDGIFPSADNPEYHRKKAEHDEKIASAATKAVLAEHGHLSDRMQPMRKNPPAAQAPTPPMAAAPSPKPPKAQGTGLQVDPSLATRFPEAPASPVSEPAVEPAAKPLAEPAPAENSPAQATNHPLLKKLREDFGIDHIPLEDISINGHIFTMRVLDTASVTASLRFADTLSITPRENIINLQIALVSFAVLAIDGEPLWKIFEIPLGHDEKIMVEGQERPVFDPMKPPLRVRTMGATQFMDFLNNTATASLIEELWKTYNSRVDPKASLEKLTERILEEEDEEEAESANIPLP